jgi:hypothetical protein
MKAALVGVLGGLQNLDHDEAHERPVDRLGAAGMIGRGAARARQAEKATNAERESILCSLGVDLIRFKYSNVAAARLDAEDMLALALAWRPRLNLSRRERTRVARWAVQEWAIDLCPTCKGAKVVPDHDAKGLEGVQPMKPCCECGSTGKRRYSDAERVEALGATFEKAMMDAHEFIASAEGLAVGRVRKSLERP